MSGVIGQASDFFRLRLARYDELGGVDFEWRDDILYREPPVARVHETELWAVEAVELDDPDTVHTVGRFKTRAEAQDILAEVEETLGELTRSQFEGRYLAGSDAPPST